MVTYPLRVALSRADMFGWELTALAKHPTTNVAKLTHHRTKQAATLMCNDVGAGGTYSDHWWLDTGDDEITLVGRSTVSA